MTAGSSPECSGHEFKDPSQISYLEDAFDVGGMKRQVSQRRGA